MLIKRPLLCIYHADCADGFGAAWAVKKAHPLAEFFGADYDKPPPDVTGRRVVFVDFSYKRAAMLDLAASAEQILVLDHHKGAQEELIDLPANVEVILDMERSGARMAWDHFHPEEPPPELINYIQDRDLWRFRKNGTRQILAAVFSYQYDFTEWDQLMIVDPLKLYSEGVGIERAHQKDVDEAVARTQRWIRILGHVVPVANVNRHLASDAGHKMMRDFQPPFAACYWDTPNGREFALRSNDSAVDVQAVAKAYGGNGHRNAAGFTTFDWLQFEMSADEIQQHKAGIGHG